ncbi:MAG: ABC transporter substrate-binding protein [Caldilineaceae bacterium]|nr:ABC transporter substrate-binding protein [Caldilineaceae bacterium]
MKRFSVLLSCLLSAAILLLSACGGGAAPAAPAAQDAASTAPAAAAPAAVPTSVGEVPRNRTLIVAQKTSYPPGEMWSPYNLGGTHQAGIQFFYEPLVYADMLDGHAYPWLAERWEYNEDATELTYYLRQGVTWSDGEPFTAADVAYTLNTLRDLGSTVRTGGVYQVFVKEAVAVDDLTVNIVFNSPAPRFHDEVMVAKGDSATFVVPQHIWEGQDWAEYTAYNDGAGPVTTSPWRLAFADDTRRMIDRVQSCEEWWACATGFHELPQVERYVQLIIGDDQSQATAMIRNEIDQTHDLRVDIIEKILAENPEATTWTGREGPYGMVSWWPTALHLNNKDPHLGKKEVRWAINRYLDRQKLIDFAYDGKGQISDWPFPPFKGLQASIDNLQDLAEQYQPNKYDAAEGDSLLTEAGYTKDNEGFWADATGSRIKCNITSFSLWTDLGPVLAETLRQHGIESSYAEPTDAYDQLAGGNYECGLFGHNGSQSGNIYRTLNLYTTGNAENLFQYSNPDFDAIVEELSTTADEAKVRELEHAAMAIWLQDLPDVQLVQFYNRTGNNQHYWTNWPSTATDPYMNGIHPHTGFAYTLLKLQATDAQ